MWHSKDKKEVLEELDSSENGISDKEAGTRLERYGLNEIKQIVRVTPLKIFLSQFKSVFVIILLAAAIFSLLIKHYVDFSVIFVIVILNSSIGFIQQFKAEKTIAELKKLLVPKVKVIREGRLEEISSVGLVPGDILVISEGDKITADCRLLQANELQINESVLTGESFPQSKSSGKISSETVLANRENMIYAGTSVVRGNAHAIVVATNMHTEFGRIAGLVQQIREEKTPFEKKLDVFSEKVAVIVLVLAAITAGIGIYRGEEIFNMILTGVSLAVSVIPEGLPAVLAVILALAIGRLKNRNVLIRKLPAAETLGRTTVICTDKTGTLTEEKMSVANVYSDRQFYHLKDNGFYLNEKKVSPSEDLTMLLRIGILCNNARLEIEGKEVKVFGDPTEEALVMSAYGAGLVKKTVLEKEKRVIEYSFSSSRKMMSVVRKKSGNLVSYVKGAPDVILNLCTKELFNGRVIKLSAKRKIELKAAYESMASEALRVLGFAYKELKKVNQEEAEGGLIFVGFQGMLDMPRKEVRMAIQDSLNAGIKVKMITGDSLLTARAVSKLIGLSGDSIECSELEKMSEEDFDTCVRDRIIFARITPEIKLKIVKSLKKAGEIVAVTGDGVNDILALKEAHIGVAMGIRGTDVARGVSDIVLLDDNFSSIVSAVREGRRVYDNMKKSIKFHLAANSGELLLVLCAMIIYLPLPLLPLPILWMNLITDSLPGISLSFEEEDRGIMSRGPMENGQNSLLTHIWKFTIVAGILLFISVIVLFLMYYALDLAKARTMALTTAVFFEMFLVFVCRSDKNIWKVGFLSNKPLFFAVALTIVLQFIAIYTPLAGVFGLVPLSFGELLFAIGASSSGFVFFETMKALKIKI